MNEHQVYHIIRSFLTVSETGEKALPALFSASKAAFAAFVASDTDLNDDMKSAAMLGNRNVPLTGHKIWTRAKDYKSNFLNKYQPIKRNEPIPSGMSNDDDIIDLVRKKFWFKKEVETARSKEVDPPLSCDACPQTFQPVDFFAYRKLHEHVKLQMVISNKRTNSDPESSTTIEGTVRSKTPSRKQQRQMDRTMKETARAARHGSNAGRDVTLASSLSARRRTGSSTGIQDLMERKLMAARFDQKFALAKFCVEHDIEGGKKMIQKMMDKEMRNDDDDDDFPAPMPPVPMPPASMLITQKSTDDLSSGLSSDEEPDDELHI